MALAGRGGAEAAPAGSTPSVAQPAPKKKKNPKKTLAEHVTESNKALEGGEKKKKQSCPAQVVLMYYANVPSEMKHF